jgi:hypothetical protein
MDSKYFILGLFGVRFGVLGSFERSSKHPLPTASPVFVSQRNDSPWRAIRASPLAWGGGKMRCL